MSETRKATRFEDCRGSLFPFEIGREIPFTVQRCFFLCNMPVGAVRGNHANINGESVIILAAGSIEVELSDNVGKKEYTLQTVGEYIYVPKNTWVKVLNKDIQKSAHR